jgi:hypothetical protein
VGWDFLGTLWKVRYGERRVRRRSIALSKAIGKLNPPNKVMLRPSPLVLTQLDRGLRPMN